VMGIERAEAHRFARSVDWRTTLLVPVPVDTGRFRQVDVQGHPGLLIESNREVPGHVARELHLMWSSGDSVFVATGNVDRSELFEIAQTLQ
jgi:hypothetical protein